MAAKYAKLKAAYDAAAPQREAEAAVVRRGRDEDEARRYENIAKAHADKVQRGNFMTTRKYNKLREIEYRRVLNLLLSGEYISVLGTIRAPYGNHNHRD